MKIKSIRKSVSFKITALYISLAIINMSFFTIIIYENQIDLITENTKYRITELTDNLINTLNRYSAGFSSRDKSSLKRGVMAKEVADIIKEITDEFCIFAEDGEVIYRSCESVSIGQTDILNGLRAVTNRDFTGKRFYSKVDEDKLEISFYIPFSIRTMERSVLFIRFSMNEINDRLSQLYRIIALILSAIAVFHLLFAVLLFRIFVRPITLLHEKSLEIEGGNLSARAEIERDDEIGELARAFNRMADAVQDKIVTLEYHREMMEQELEMASKVQEVIFPHITNNSRFNFSIYSRAAERVSGDYYDIFDLGNNAYGFLLVDVQGHGVPAAMVTMIIKEKFREYTKRYADPAELFRFINREIISILSEVGKDAALYFTAFYLVIDSDNYIHSVDAGHLRPFLIRKEENELTLLKSGGLPLGISEDMEELYVAHKTRIKAGDKIVLFTDGIIEARNPEGMEFGMDRLIACIKAGYKYNSDELMKFIMRGLAGFANLDTLRDDATVFIVELK
ncbi:MAG TPA: SpoIIE family protein phosphatase [Spirochaetota bacterium]|nr:SpoIIE family protein phosphatase [Spirochaetota bacterium]HPJ33912.1 SpoIIE family protein phosphatase [Spirochaetota bacterium]